MAIVGMMIEAAMLSCQGLIQACCLSAAARQVLSQIRA
jgi:hypothetical protein